MATPQPRKLNLGSGGRKLDGFLNIDMMASENPDVVLNLGTEKWPWSTDSIDEAAAFHVLEHLPGNQFFHFMQELYRVLMPRAECRIILPHPRHDVFLNDPTHARAVTPDGIAMFSQHAYKMMMEKHQARLTPLWRYFRIDFDMVSPLQYALDPDLPKDWLENDLWREKEKHFSNVVVEWHFRIRAVKPFIDECDF